MRTLRQRTEDGTFELDLAPMLSMMVALIPILLLSVIFVRVTVIETPIPQVVAKAVEKDKKDKNPVSISIEANKKNGIRIRVTENGRSNSKRIPLKSSELNYQALHEHLVQVKIRHPKVFNVNIKPSDDLSYQEIVKVMDAARETQKGDPVLKFKDEETQKEVEHRVLFPNINFANVVEG